MCFITIYDDEMIIVASSNSICDKNKDLQYMYIILEQTIFLLYSWSSDFNKNIK